MIGVHFTSKTAEWYTPHIIVTRTIATMGAIDLDPCSEGGGHIPAAAHFTRADNGLLHGWPGRIYMNPPYGREIGKWIVKLASEYAGGRTIQAVALVPARTDTAWWNAIDADAVCFIRGRLRFSGASWGAPFPSAVLYLGNHKLRFEECFGDIGAIWGKVWSATTALSRA